MDEEGCSSETFNVIEGIPDDACVPEDEPSDNPDSWSPPCAPYASDSPECILSRLLVHQYYKTNVFDLITEHPKWRGENEIDLRGVGEEAWARIRERSRASVHLKRCPAPNPISMDKEHLQIVSDPRSKYGEYLVTPKADGTRYQLLLTYGRSDFVGGNTEPLALMIDRKMDCYPVRVEAPDAAFAGTLIDGEIVMISGKPTFLVIDFVAAAGNCEFSKMSLDRRLAAAEKAVKSISLFFTPSSEGEEESGEGGGGGAGGCRMPIVVKQYFPVKLAYELFVDPSRFVPYKTDGIIFVSKDLQVAKFTCPVAFKVKPHHTIDLLLVAEPCRDSAGRIVEVDEVLPATATATATTKEARYRHTGDTIYRQTIIEQRRMSLDMEAKLLSSAAASKKGDHHPPSIEGPEREEIKRRRASVKDDKISLEKAKSQEKSKQMTSFMMRLKQQKGQARPETRPGGARPQTPMSPPPAATQQRAVPAPPPPPPTDRPPVEVILPPPPPPAAAAAAAAEPELSNKKRKRYKWLIKLMYLVGDRLQDAATGLNMKDDILAFRLQKNEKIEEILNRFDAAWDSISATGRASNPFVPVSLKCVVECACDFVQSESRVLCSIERIRRDKREPNSYSVIVGTLMSMNVGVTREDLRSMCEN